MKRSPDFLINLAHPLFKNLTHDEFEQILAAADLKIFKKGNILIHEGEMNLLVYVILSGTVSVTRKDESLKKIITLATLGEKHVVGEISIITKKPKTATVTALVDTEVLMIDFAKIATSVEYKDVYNKLLGNLADEMAKKLVFSVDAATKAAGKEAVIFDENSTHIPNAIVILFGWRWKDILLEIPFLAEHGYDAIKISPPQEFAVLTGRPWYEMYQPVTYNLSSSYGNEEDFRAMVDIAHTYGVKVYADLVMNHMAEYPLQATNHIGTNGNKFSRFKYGPLNSDSDFYEYDDFYHFGAEEANPIIQPEDYSTFDKTWRVEHFDLNYLPKLNFYNPHVIEVLRKYVSYLLYLGIDGFRIDAAKHISTDALVKILRGLKTRDGLNPFIYLEYYASFPLGIDPYSFMNKYFQIGCVTSFSYGELLADAICKRNNNLEKLVLYSFGESWINYPANRTVAVLDNHDTERVMANHLNYKDAKENSYVLAYIFMLTWPFAVPKIMSSFRFAGFDEAIPSTNIWQNGRNTCFDSGSPWVCQHRWRAISNMALFRKKMKDAPGITHVWTNGDQIAFARSQQKLGEYVVSKGFVVINNSAEKLMRKFETSLPAGRYFNLIDSELVEGKMRGPTLLVEDYGFVEISVKPYDAVVICIDFMEDSK